MSETPAPQDPVIPLRIPASHLKVVFAGLGKLPLEIAGPTDAFLKTQISQLAQIAKAQAEKQQIVDDAIPLPEVPTSTKSPRAKGKK